MKIYLSKGCCGLRNPTAKRNLFRSFNISFRKSSFIKVWYPLPWLFSHRRTS